MGDHAGLCAAASDNDIHTTSEAFLLELRIDDARTYHRIKMSFIYFKLGHAFEINEQGIFNMRVRARPVKSCAVGDIGDIVAVADLDDLLNLIRSQGHDDAARYFCHHPLITKTALIAAGPGAIAFADGGIAGNIFLPNDCFQDSIFIFGYLVEYHSLTSLTR